MKKILELTDNDKQIIKEAIQNNSTLIIPHCIKINLVQKIVKQFNIGSLRIRYWDDAFFLKEDEKYSNNYIYTNEILKEAVGQTIYNKIDKTIKTSFQNLYNKI